MPRPIKTDAARAAGFTGGRPKDETKLSREPRRIRKRLRHAINSKAGQDAKLDQIERDMEMLYKKPISEWDFAELAMGHPRNSRGKFSGSAPSWCGPVIQREAKQRLLTVTKGKLAGYIDDAIAAIGQLITSEEVDDKGKPIVDARTKLAAAQFVLENFLGKAKAFVEVEATDHTRAAIASAIVLDDGLPQGHLTIVEGEFTEDDDDDEDEANG